MKILNKHLMKHLLPEKQITNPYKCDKCDKTFAKVQNMNTHRALLHELF